MTTPGPAFGNPVTQGSESIPSCHCAARPRLARAISLLPPQKPPGPKTPRGHERNPRPTEGRRVPEGEATRKAAGTFRSHQGAHREEGKAGRPAGKPGRGPRGHSHGHSASSTSVRAVEQARGSAGPLEHGEAEACAHAQASSRTGEMGASRALQDGGMGAPPESEPCSTSGVTAIRHAGTGFWVAKLG